MRKYCYSFFILLIAINLVKAQNVGVGTLTPTDKLHVNAATGANPLLIQINSVNKLRVNTNGGTTIGSAAVAPADGLYVAGVTNPVGGIRAAANPISIQSSNDSVEIIAGQNRIVIAANGGIRIIAANGTNGITIDAGGGDLNLNGNNVNIKAANNCNATANKLVTLSKDSTSISTLEGSIALNSAKSTDITSAFFLNVTTGVSSTLTSGANLLITTGANTAVTTGGTTEISSDGSMQLKTGNNMSFIAGTNYSVNAGSDLTIGAAAISRINGTLVVLNNGSKGAARVTDITQTSLFSGVGSISTGSATVLIGN